MRSVLQTYFRDDAHTHILKLDGSYKRLQSKDKNEGAQEWLMNNPWKKKVKA